MASCSYVWWSMSTYSLPLRYRYCIGLRAKETCATRSSEAKLRSSTAPLRRLRSLARTKACRCACLEWWMSMTAYSSPSSWMTTPGRNSLLAITGCILSTAVEPRNSPGARPGARSEDHQMPGGSGQDLAPLRGNHHQLLDPDTAPPRQVHTGFYRDRHPRLQRGVFPRRQGRPFMNGQPDPVSQSVPEVITMPGVGDHLTGQRIGLPARQP